MADFDIATIRLKLCDLQGLLAFTHEAVRSGGTRLEYDTKDGLVAILRQCKEITQAALEEIAQHKAGGHHE